MDEATQAEAPDMVEVEQAQPATTRLIDRIARKYDAGRKRVVVEEWDAELFFGPLTTQDIDNVDARMRDEYGEEPDKHKLDKNILLLISKAELADGTKAFRWGDRITLKAKGAYTVVQGLILAMYSAGVQSKQIESRQQLKNESSETET